MVKKPKKVLQLLRTNSSQLNKYFEFYTHTQLYSINPHPSSPQRTTTTTTMLNLSEKYGIHLAAAAVAAHPPPTSIINPQQQQQQ